jgi:hypothetical protein
MEVEEKDDQATVEQEWHQKADKSEIEMNEIRAFSKVQQEYNDQELERQRAKTEQENGRNERPRAMTLTTSSEMCRPIELHKMLPMSVSGVFVAGEEDSSLGIPKNPSGPGFNNLPYGSVLDGKRGTKIGRPFLEDLSGRGTMRRDRDEVRDSTTTTTTEIGMCGPPPLESKEATLPVWRKGFNVMGSPTDSRPIKFQGDSVEQRFTPVNWNQNYLGPGGQNNYSNGGEIVTSTRGKPLNVENTFDGLARNSQIPGVVTQTVMTVPICSP